MSEEQEIWNLLATVPDPEVPVLSILDLGIVREVKLLEPLISVEIMITPTYSGCPAMDAISINIRMVLLQNGYSHIKITNVLSPAWSSDWISDRGKEKLKAYGIAPPVYSRRKATAELFAEPDTVQCPQCNSYNTTMISEFGSTACKALYRCNDCHEPFDYFKCH